jgi:tetratricopeptide (TPR) repeat protein
MPSPVAPPLAWLCAIALACASPLPLADNPDRAKAALDRGDYRMAESLYRSALQISPNSPQLLSNLGLTLQMEGRYGEAEHILKQALRLKYLPLAYALLAVERCRTRSLDEAKPMIDRLFRENGRDVAIMAIVAPCYLEEDEPLAAVEVYSLLAASHQYPRDLAMIQLTKADIAAAQFFTTKLKDSNGSTDYVAAIINARDGASGNARAAYPLAQKRSSNFHPEATYETALEGWRQHPGDAALLYQLVVLAGEDALKTIQVCQREFPDSVYLQQFRAEVLADQGQEAEAIATLEQLIATHPETPDVRYTLGMLYRKAGDWEHAAIVFGDQLHANPQDERCAAHLSEALLNLNRFDEMVTLLKPRVDAPHPVTWALLDLATAEQKLGDPRTAIQLLVSAEREDPSNKTIHYRLMRLYSLTGDSAAALRENARFRDAAASRQ